MKKIHVQEVLATPLCFRQRVNLPRAQVTGLSEAELASALGFEIEPFSGIPRAEGRIAWRDVGTADAPRAVFDVVQIRNSDLAREVARARGARRVVRAVTAQPEAAMGERIEDLPWIPVGESRGGLRRGVSAWCAICLAGMLYAAYDAWTLRGVEREGMREVAVQRQLQAERDRLNGEVTALQREMQEIRERRAAEARAQQNADVLRAAWRVLLEAISTACGKDSVIRRIEGTGSHSAQVTGVAPSVKAATQTLVRLSAAVQSPKSAWRVTPGEIGSGENGGSVTFSCTVEFDPKEQFK